MTVRPFRRRPQFSLRTFAVVITLFASWLGYISHRAREQRVIVARIEELGGKVEYDYEWGPSHRTSPPGWSWLRRLIGNEYFQDVYDVSLSDTKANDEDMRLIVRLRGIQGLHVDGTEISDGGVATIAELPRLRFLTLSNTSVTSQGIKELIKSKRLLMLSIGDTPTDDSAIPFLMQVKSLRSLFVRNSRITGAAFFALKNKSPYIDINRATADYSGKLNSDDPEMARVTWEVILDRLKEQNDDHELKLLILADSAITDHHLATLESLNYLETLDLRGSSVTDAGIEKLQRECPNLKIHR